MLFNCIKESFKYSNQCVILATPLILFSLIFGIYILVTLGGSVVSLIFSVIVAIIMLAVFLSGWFSMVVRCVKESETDDYFGLMSEFTAGVGKYFLSALGMLLISFLFALGMMFLVYYAGIHFAGRLENFA